MKFKGGGCGGGKKLFLSNLLNYEKFKVVQMVVDAENHRPMLFNR